MKKLKLVMVGNGMAGVRTLEELLKIAPDLYDITVFGAEPHPNYNRILLSPVLAGEQTIDEIILNDWQWYADNHITLHTGFTVTDVDRVRRVVSATSKDGDVITAEYDRLIIATGSNPFILPIPGKDLQGVVTLLPGARQAKQRCAEAEYDPCSDCHVHTHPLRPLSLLKVSDGSGSHLTSKSGRPLIRPGSHKTVLGK